MSTLDYDTRRGNCYVRADNGRILASLHDMGGACAVMTEGDLTAEEATLLGHALISWSAWRRRVIPAVDHYQRTYGETRAPGGEAAVLALGDASTGEISDRGHSVALSMDSDEGEGTR